MNGSPETLVETRLGRLPEINEVSARLCWISARHSFMGVAVPKRTLTFKRIRRHRSGPQKATPLDQFGGHDLLHLFRSWAESIATKDQLSDTTQKQYLRIERVTYGGRWVLVDAEFGHYGEPGNTRDVVTDAVVHARGADHAPTEHSRLMFVLPAGATSGFFLIEKSGAYGAGVRIVDRFRLDLLGAFSKEEWIVETVTESTAWNVGAQLLSVTAVAHGFPIDIGDGNSKTMEGRIEQMLVPDKGMGRYLPIALFHRLRNGEIATSEVMAFPEDVPIDDTVIEVENNGQTKKYSLDREGVPSMRVLLNEANEASLTQTEFSTRCLDEVQDLRALEGEPWEEKWRSGKWTSEALAVTFPSAGTS